MTVRSTAATRCATIRAALPTLRHVVHVPYGEHVVPDAVSWDELLAEPGPLEFLPVAFDHPLFVLFSSGTTGRPKAIVHGHGGILLELLKAHAFSWDLKPGGRLLWFSTTSWMMWNALVAALLVRSSIVMLDGDPGWPDLGWQWRVAEETRPTFMGVSPTFLMACRKAGLEPGREYDLGSIRVFGTAGSPLPAEGYRYVYEQLGPDVLLINGSGGTDVCSGIVGGSPLLPVYEGEISGRLLGVATEAFDQDGKPVVGELGELVITKPMPSMPVELWGDTDGSLYRSSYFDMFPGIWRQGDWIRFSERGSCVVTGRSDATLNRGGVRLGTGEFYSVVEELPEVTDGLVVHLEDDEGGAGELVLFVVLADGIELDDELRGTIGRQPARAALTTPRAGHDPGRTGDPPHADREEARGAGQAHPPRRSGRRRREPGLAPRPRPPSTSSLRSWPASRRYRRTVAVAGSERLSLEDVVAIDVHAHVEMSEAGVDSLPDELRDAAVKHFRGQSARPTADELAQYYRERRMMAVVFTVDAESITGQPRVPNEEIAEVARANADVLIPFASIDPHKGRRGVDEARRLIAEHGVGLQVPPQHAGVLPERPPGLPALRSDRRGRAAGAVPHRASGIGSGMPGRRRHPAQVLEPDPRRRRRRRLPGAQDHPRAPLVSLAGRGDLGRDAQAARLHRPLRVVAEVLPAQTRPVRQHAAAGQGAVRQRLPVHHARPLDRRLRDARHQAEVRPLILKENAMRLLGLGSPEEE